MDTGAMHDSTQQPARRQNKLKKAKHRKTKSGCRTCKIRKVKCDEEWPACRTCISTGRVCDGYGIWGGGGNRYEQRRPGGSTAEPLKLSRCSESVEVLVRKSPFCSKVSVRNTEEHLHFQFFKDETLSRLPGVYSRKYNNVWEVLILQACAEEPAVLHAVLAISSAHRRKVLDGVSRSWVQDRPDHEEQFLLHNYSKSIAYLQPKYHLSGAHSLLTTLITCLIFIYLELLRGNYQRACAHLSSGLTLLPSLPSQNAITAFLTEALSRLRIQTTFCNARLGKGSLLTSSPTTLPTTFTALPHFKFYSPSEARHYLDRIFEGVTRLTHALRDGTHTSWPPSYWETLRTEQRLMQGSLDAWACSYDATLAAGNFEDDDDGNTYAILRVYHCMADIMAATCLFPDQSAFDEYEAGFREIVARCEGIAGSGGSGGSGGFNGCIDGDDNGDEKERRTTRAWPDVSWIPPLYYTALKCRVHGVRTRAVELMEGFWRFEIVWDVGVLNMAGVVAREVIRMEEWGWGEGKVEGGEGGEWVVPVERRFDAVEMVLGEEGKGGMEIVCRRFEKGEEEAVRKVYDEVEGVWVKVEG